MSVVISKEYRTAEKVRTYMRGQCRTRQPMGTDKGSAIGGHRRNRLSSEMTLRLSFFFASRPVLEILHPFLVSKMPIAHVLRCSDSISCVVDPFTVDEPFLWRFLCVGQPLLHVDSPYLSPSVPQARSAYMGLGVAKGPCTMHSRRHVSCV